MQSEQSMMHQSSLINQQSTSKNSPHKRICQLHTNTRQVQGRKERQLKQQELAKAEKKRLEREREEEDKRTTPAIQEKQTFKERV